MATPASTKPTREPTTVPPTAEPPSNGAGGGQQLVRVTVNLTKRSHDDLTQLADLTGLGKTDVINRALQVYSLVQNLIKQGDGRLTVVHPDQTVERIYIL